MEVQEMSVHDTGERISRPLVEDHVRDRNLTQQPTETISTVGQNTEEITSAAQNFEEEELAFDVKLPVIRTIPLPLQATLIDVHDGARNKKVKKKKRKTVEHIDEIDAIFG
jgi:hypothetical protein